MSTFQSGSPGCGPAPCGKAERALRAWGPSWHDPKWQPNAAEAFVGHEVGGGGGQLKAWPLGGAQA